MLLKASGQKFDYPGSFILQIHCFGAFETEDVLTFFATLREAVRAGLPVFPLHVPLSHLSSLVNLLSLALSVSL